VIRRIFPLPAVCAAAVLFSLVLRAGEPDQKTLYRIAPEPEWIDPVLLPERDEIPEDQVRGGIYYLLSDEQVRVEPRETYGQYARKFLNETGVQSGSEIHLTVNPAYETLELHKVEVLRDGVWQQRLTPRIISVLQRETDMEKFMLDGRYTVVVRLTDIRSGDVLRYSFTRRGANPVMAGHFYERFSAGWNEPCALLRERIVAPAGKRLFFKNHNTDSQPRAVETGTETIYEWRALDLPATSSEENVPYWQDVYPWIEAGDMEDWREVVDWALPLYDFDQLLPPDLETEITTLQVKDSSEEKILGALRLVQDEIRYFGTETGENSHRPRPPAEVYAQRLGDCKEKSLLLGTILRRLGFEAWPVLVSSEWGRGIESLLPSPAAFDHVILQTSLDGHDYFLDPTRSHQRGPLRSLPIEDYGLGLIVREGETRLSAVQPPPESLSRREVEEIVNLPDTTNAAPATFKVYTVLHGEAAEDARERFASENRKDLQDQYKRFYADTYPTIEVARPVRCADNERDNIFEIWEEYRIPDIWKSSSEKNRVSLSFYPQEITAYLKKPGTSGRQHAYELPHPVDVRQKTYINLPEAWSIKPSDFHEANKYFDVSYNVSRDGGSNAVISSRFRSLADHVSADALKSYRSGVEKSLDALGYQFTYTANAEEPRSATNWLSLWPMFVTAAIGFLVSLAAAFAIWWNHQKTPPRFPVHADRHLDGLGGWLIVVAIILIIRPFVAIVALGGIFAPYVTSPQIWQFFTSPEGQYYSPLWLPIFVFEIFVNTALVVFDVFLLLLFFAKKKSFPKTFVAVLAIMLVCGILDAALISAIPKDHFPGDMRTALNSAAKDSASNIIAALIWIPYLLISRRVKTTFRR
jgi:transglutaminase-like putative cysteine protease